MFTHSSPEKNENSFFNICCCCFVAALRLFRSREKELKKISIELFRLKRKRKRDEKWKSNFEHTKKHKRKQINKVLKKKNLFKYMTYWINNEHHRDRKIVLNLHTLLLLLFRCLDFSTRRAIFHPSEYVMFGKICKTNMQTMFTFFGGFENRLFAKKSDGNKKAKGNK